MKKIIYELITCIIISVIILCGCSDGGGKNVAEKNENEEFPDYIDEEVLVYVNQTELSSSESIAGISREDAESYLLDAQCRASGIIPDKETEEAYIIDPYLTYSEYHFLRDDDFILAVYPVDAGMQRVYYLFVRSTDSGKTWEIAQNTFSACQGITDMQIYDNYVIMTHGVGFFPLVMISDDYGQTFKEINAGETLPEYCSFFSDRISGKVVNLNAETGSIWIDWYCDDSLYRVISTEFDLNLNLIKVSDVYSDFSETLDFLRFYEETGYVFKDSSENYLVQNEIENILDDLNILVSTDFSRFILRRAINEIYARKGYDFTGTEYESIFSAQAWYVPIPGKMLEEYELNEYEKSNIDLLVELEKKICNPAMD